MKESNKTSFRQSNKLIQVFNYQSLNFIHHKQRNSKNLISKQNFFFNFTKFSPWKIFKSQKSVTTFNKASSLDSAQWKFLILSIFLNIISLSIFNFPLFKSHWNLFDLIARKVITVSDSQKWQSAIGKFAQVQQNRKSGKNYRQCKYVVVVEIRCSHTHPEQQKVNIFQVKTRSFLAFVSHFLALCFALFVAKKRLSRSPSQHHMVCWPLQSKVLTLNRQLVLNCSQN